MQMVFTEGGASSPLPVCQHRSQRVLSGKRKWGILLGWGPRWPLQSQGPSSASAPSPFSPVISDSHHFNSLTSRSLTSLRLRPEPFSVLRTHILNCLLIIYLYQPLIRQLKRKYIHKFYMYTSERFHLLLPPLSSDLQHFLHGLFYTICFEVILSVQKKCQNNLKNSCISFT